MRGDKMRDFFARNVDFDSGLPMFGGLHLTLCALLFIFGALIIFFRDKLRKFGHSDAMRLTLHRADAYRRVAFFRGLAPAHLLYHELFYDLHSVH